MGGQRRRPRGAHRVLDNRGTLWCEKPAYIQLDFTIRQLAGKADGDPGFCGAVTNHYRGDDDDLKWLFSDDHLLGCGGAEFAQTFRAGRSG